MKEDGPNRVALPIRQNKTNKKNSHHNNNNDDDNDSDEFEEDKYDVNDESSVRIKKLRSMELQGGTLSLEPADASLAVVHGRYIFHFYVLVFV